MTWLHKVAGYVFPKDRQFNATTRQKAVDGEQEKLCCFCDLRVFEGAR